MLIAVILDMFLGLKILPINSLRSVFIEIIIMLFSISPCRYVNHATLSANSAPSDPIAFMVHFL